MTITLINIGAPEIPVIPFGTNMRVELKITMGTNEILATDGSALSANLNHIFYTQADPLYADVDYIVLSGGEVLQGIPGAAIYLMAYSASSMANDILLFDPATIDSSSRQWSYFQRARTEYVRCKATLELLRAIISSKGTMAGRKTLADFTIDTSTIANFLGQIRQYLSDLSEECRYWRDILFSGGKADAHAPAPKTAVKSGSNARDNAVGIGRNWEIGGATLDSRSSATQSGDSYTRPVRFSSRPGNGLW